jgi:hypothetical protein
MNDSPADRATREYEEHVLAQRRLVEQAQNIWVPYLDSPHTPETKEIAKRLGANGFALNRWWVLTPPNWLCPSCGRSKARFARLNTGGRLFGEIHAHHDHMTDLIEKRFIEAAVERHWPDLTDRACRFAVRAAPMVSAYDV